MKARYDAIVIGASIGGLAAASLLARGGARVLLLEKRLAPPEPSGPLFALDPVLVKKLKLTQHGLALRQRNLGLALWDDEEDDLVLPRELAKLSRADAQAWPAFQSELMAQARAALMPSSMETPPPSWPLATSLPSASRQSWPETTMKLPVRTKGT